MQQPPYNAFNEQVSVDLMVPFHRAGIGNGHVVVIQDHFCMWIGGAVVPSKVVLWLQTSCRNGFTNSTPNPT